jgi:TonB family protein
VAALLLSLGLPLLTSAPLSDALARTWPSQEVAVQSVPTTATLTTEISPLPFTTEDTRSTFVLVNAKLAWTLFFVYLAVILFNSTRLVMAWRRTRRIVRSASFIASDVRLDLIIENCKAVIGVQNATVLSSLSVPVPITVGFRRPVIIIPEKLLSEPDSELLKSGIGHELIHVRRKDYVLNLLYELIYLPLSFHPAAALIRRQISRTRELSCDELVAEKLQNARVYARSLVQLAAWAPPMARLAKSTTVGIADADNLEARVMSLLKNPKLKVQRKKLLFIAVSLILAVPVLAGAAFALQFDVAVQGPFEDKRLKPIVRPMPEYTEDARAQKIEGSVGMLLTIDPKGAVRNVEVTKPLFPSLDKSAVAAVRTWQFAPYEVDGKPIERKVSTEINFNLRAWEQDKERQSEEREKRELLEKLKREAGEKDEELVTKRRLEIEIKSKAQAELARHAKISMDQAIQIATSKYPGTVMEGSLVAEHWEAMGVLAKDSDVFYHLRIISPGDEIEILHVLVSATDGHIVKAEKEKKNEESGPFSKTVRGGVLNSRALSLPAPEYPAIARAAGAEGMVVVDVVIDEAGNVVEARAISGHPLLQSAAVNASRDAKFTPTRLEGEPVRVRGSITYSFVKQ